MVNKFINAIGSHCTKSAHTSIIVSIATIIAADNGDNIVAVNGDFIPENFEYISEQNLT